MWNLKRVSHFVFFFFFFFLLFSPLACKSIFIWIHSIESRWSSDGVKRRIKMAALTLPLLTETTVEAKTSTCTDRRHPTYHWRPQINEIMITCPVLFILYTQPLPDTERHYVLHHMLADDAVLYSSAPRSITDSLTCNMQKLCQWRKEVDHPQPASTERR